MVLTGLESQHATQIVQQASHICDDDDQPKKEKKQKGTNTSEVVARKVFSSFVFSGHAPFSFSLDVDGYVFIENAAILMPHYVAKSV